MDLTQLRKKVGALIIDIEDETSSATLVHDVIPDTGVFNPQGSGHTRWVLLLAIYYKI